MILLSTVGKKTIVNFDMPHLLKKNNKYFAFLKLLSSSLVMPMLFFSSKMFVGLVML